MISIKNNSRINRNKHGTFILRISIFSFVTVPAHYGFYPAVCPHYDDLGLNLATVCMFNTQHSKKIKILHGNKNTVTHSHIINTQVI